LNLKAGERAVLGNTIIRNAGSHTATVLVENQVPVLRARDILNGINARTPCEHIYLLLQLAYLEPERAAGLQQSYLDLVRDVLAAAPSLRNTLERISFCVAKRSYYRALRHAQELLKQEQRLLSQAQPSRNTAEISTSEESSGQEFDDKLALLVGESAG
jgi:flagellar protein FlbT